MWELAHQQWSDFLITRKLTPIIDSEFKLEQIEEAHQYMETGNHFGKIIINML
ncbi:MAG: zinc-binding dehydrogenase [bacterium]|nr:zinc-binding dehydrogenase [bacterium]